MFRDLLQVQTLVRPSWHPGLRFGGGGPQLLHDGRVPLAVACDIKTPLGELHSVPLARPDGPRAARGKHRHRGPLRPDAPRAARAKLDDDDCDDDDDENDDDGDDDDDDDDDDEDDG